MLLNGVSFYRSFSTYENFALFISVYPSSTPNYFTNVMAWRFVSQTHHLQVLTRRPSVGPPLHLSDRSTARQVDNAGLLWALTNELSISAVAADLISYLKGPGFNRTERLLWLLACTSGPVGMTSAFGGERWFQIRSRPREQIQVIYD